ncbi:MAG: peptidylprolyl isomerase [Fusobacteriaceae bacterium]|jgi:peptidyl-prolyl cis-trans isomerase D|nr:peptidylprolyl isomerase [Fusobacteriaceae bacterium]
MNKFRKHMKIVIWIVTILLVFSGMAAIVTSDATTRAVKNLFSKENDGSYAFLLNGKKVSLVEVERTRANYGQQLNVGGYKNVDQDTLGVIAFDEVINKRLTLELADKAGVKVANAEADQRYDAQEKAITSQGGNFREWMRMNGYATKDDLLGDIEDGIKMEKYLAKLQTEAKDPTEEEISAIYNENPAYQAAGKTLDDARGEIVANVKKGAGERNYYLALAKAQSEKKLEQINKNYEKYRQKEAFSEGGYSVSNVDVARLTLTLLPYIQGDKAQAEEQVASFFKKQIALANKAKEQGITLDESLPLQVKLMDYQVALYDKIRSEIKPTDGELEAYFAENKASYDTKAEATAEVAVMDVDFSDADRKAAKDKAAAILKQATPENFKDLAKENSQDGSAASGGDLGWFTRDQMVKEFSDAVFAGEPGKIYPEVVTSQFGEHIIYVEDLNREENKAKASHIIIMPQLSQKTKDGVKPKLDDMIAKIGKGEATLLKLNELDPKIIYANTFAGITPEGYVPNIGVLKEFADAVFASGTDKISYVFMGNRCFIFKKISEVKFKEGDFAELKDRIRSDYINATAQKEIEKLF